MYSLNDSPENASVDRGVNTEPVAAPSPKPITSRRNPRRELIAFMCESPTPTPLLLCIKIDGGEVVGLLGESVATSSAYFDFFSEINAGDWNAWVSFSRYAVARMGTQKRMGTLRTGTLATHTLAGIVVKNANCISVEQRQLSMAKSVDYEMTL